MAIDFIYDESDSLSQQRYDSGTVLNQYQLSQAALSIDKARVAQPIDTLELQSALNILSSITPYDSIEYFAKEYLSIRANMYGRNLGDTAYTQNEISQLRLIASLCPYRVGMTVYEARSVLWYLFREEYRNECEVLSPDEDKSADPLGNIMQSIVDNLNRKNGQGVTVSKSCITPNPTTGEIILWCLKTNKEGYRFDLEDIQGKRVYSTFSTTSSLNLNFANGIYIYKVWHGSELLDYGKLIIIKN